jgi:hypothetical protein
MEVIVKLDRFKDSVFVGADIAVNSGKELHRAIDEAHCREVLATEFPSELIRVGFPEEYAVALMTRLGREREVVLYLDSAEAAQLGI